MQIYKDNGFNIITYPHYGALFKMLDAGIFDYFSRGINEVWEEYEIYKKEIPDLHVEESILLQHPIVMNFFFSKTKRGEQLAGRFEEGFEIIIKNGKFDAVFDKYFGETIKKANLKNRKLYKIENKNISKHSTAQQRASMDKSAAIKVGYKTTSNHLIKCHSSET